MAGSQLKNLKAALKARGLTGQTNVKSKNKKNSKRQAKEYDREEKKKRPLLKSEKSLIRLK